jgi:hypothetical protein
MYRTHRTKILVLAAFVSVLAVSTTARAQWKCVEGRIVSRWAKDVSPDRVHPEYPRPQLVRKDWMNLNGLWQYAPAEANQPAPIGKALNGEILVPFPVESALSGVGKHFERLWYRRTFKVPAEWKGRRVLLNFGAVDWEAAVYVNGKALGTHRGGYDAFSHDVTDTLKDGDNELVVGVFDPTDKGSQPHGKQVLNPGGIMYTPSTGIWQTVWLEPVAERSIESLSLVPDIDAGCLNVTVDARGKGGPADVTLKALDAGKEVASATGKAGQTIKLAIPRAKLWSPDSPHLYDLQVTLAAGGKQTDAVTSYFGMRKTSLGKDEKGITRMMLNNKFIFQIGPLDQGFWPDGIYLAPTDEALRYDIEATRKLGFNMARKHVKVESDRWYYWADKLGLLVWQDMPAGDTTKDRPQFRQELTRLVQGMGNHPSIIMWVVINEGWGQGDAADTKAQVDLVRKLDPSRLIDNASGWSDHKCGDVIDMHSYPGPGSPRPEESRAAVLGEFGGLGLPLKGHLWQTENWGYANMADRDQLTVKYVNLLRGVYRLKDNPGLSAAVYTQTTDCEGEVNGLMTYDREVIKADAEKMAAANRGEFPPLPQIKPVVATSEQTPAEWKYTTEKPADNWSKPDFDDSSWKVGKGGFGTEDTPGAVVGTEWKTPAIWLRRTIELPAKLPADLQIRLHHDEDADIYINGIRAARETGFVSEYYEAAISPEALASLKAGKNTLAVYCKQTSGGQFIDVGLVEVVPATQPAKGN